MTNKEILDLEFDSAGFNKTITIKEFFKEILIAFFKDGECSANKRLFNNNHWYYDLCACLAKCGAIKGETSNNCSFTVYSYDSKEAEDKILELIKQL